MRFYIYGRYHRYYGMDVTTQYALYSYRLIFANNEKSLIKIEFCVSYLLTHTMHTRHADF